MATPRRDRPDTRDGLRTVTTPELFLDLVLVFGLTQVAGLVADTPTAVGLLRGALVVAVLWSCWAAWARLGDLLDAGGGAVRVAVLAATAGLFVAAVAVPESFDDVVGGLSGPVVFAVCVAVVRALPVLVLRLGAAGDPELRGRAARGAPAPVVGAVLLLAASQATGAAQIWLWVAAVLGDGVAVLAARTDRPPASAARSAERHGRVVVVALAGSVVAVGAGVAPKATSWPIVAAALLALVASASLWWTHAAAAGAEPDAVDGGHRTPLARDAASALHLAMVLGIVLLAVGLEKAVGHVAGAVDYTLDDPLRGLPLVALFGGAALFLLALAAHTRAVAGRLAPERIVAAGVLVALVPPASMVPAIWSLVVLAAVLVALPVYETGRRGAERHEVRHAATGH